MPQIIFPIDILKHQRHWGIIMQAYSSKNLGTRVQSCDHHHSQGLEKSVGAWPLPHALVVSFPFSLPLAMMD